MSSSNIQYDPLPRSSRDLEGEEFKDKPLPRRPPRFPRLRRVCRPLYVLIAFGLFVLWQLLFNASYTNPPPFTIPEAENVYIAANIIDGALIEGAWGRSVMRLVDMVGRERVHVSIYGGPKESLEKLGAMLGCAHTLVDETAEPLDLAAIPRTVLPTGESRIKRIAYLAAVRNRALRPLEELEMRFQKVLFINDVFFDANDAARLLWGTNVKGGMARYKAACGADFVSWWKFYDTFATRDAEGYSIGVPIYPWFAGEGEGRSRRDVLEGGDVRVRSCWGGMTAFQGGYFQEQDGKRVREEGREGKGDIEVPTLPLRFRSEPEPFWDSSECCLIHADIMALPPLPTSPAASPPSKADQDHEQEDDDDPYDQGIFMNPHVRVSYDAKTQSRLHLARRIERLFTLPQAIINHFAHMPVFNARRAEVDGQVIQDRIWVALNSSSSSSSSNDMNGDGLGKRDVIGEGMDLGKEYWAKKGYYVNGERTATRGAYCGVRQLLVIKEGELKTGEGNWDNLLNELPPLGL